MALLLNRFVENDQRIMVLSDASKEMPLEKMYQQSLFFAKKHPCDEYRLELPRKTLLFKQDATIEHLKKQYALLTPEEYEEMEHEVVALPNKFYSEEEKKELHAFLFDLSLLNGNVEWAEELYYQRII